MLKDLGQSRSGCPFLNSYLGPWLSKLNEDGRNYRIAVLVWMKLSK